MVLVALAVDRHAFSAAVSKALEGHRCVFLTGLYRAEQTIAERLRVLLSAGLPWPPIVFASKPVLSDNRLAARPVGAHSATRTCLAISTFRIELTRVVFPTLIVARHRGPR